MHRPLFEKSGHFSWGKRFVFALTLIVSVTFLSQCSSTNNAVGTSGIFCDGPLGQFDVSVIPTGPGGTMVTLGITAIAPNVPEVSLTLGSAAGNQYGQTIATIAVQPGAEEITGAPLPEAMLSTYPVLILTPPGAPISEFSGAPANVCPIY